VSRRGVAGIALGTAVAMLAFAANSLLCRRALGTGAIDAVSFTTLRLCAGATMLALLTRASARGGSWAGAASLFAYALGFSLAYRRVPAATGALLLFAAVQLTMLVAGLAAGERLRPRAWLGVLLAFGGLVVLTAPGLAQPDAGGTLLMLGAGVAWGIYSLLGRGRGAPLATNAANFLRCVPLALLASLLLWRVEPLHLSVHGAGLAVASGAFASGLGYAVWYAVLPALTATQAAAVQLSVPPLAAAGGVLLLGEAATLQLLIASAMTLTGVGMAVMRRRAG
jgi:drug/metabolite transporter (DMT)-like permease